MSESKVVDLNLHRKKRDLEKALSNGGKPAFIPYSSHRRAERPFSSESSFSERILRIKDSLDRIEELMKDKDR